MKKLFVVFLAVVFLCSCTPVNQGAEAMPETGNNDTSAVAEKVQNVEMTEPTYVTTITNNSPYDEGECTEPDFSELLGSANGIEIYGKNNLTYVTPADGMMEVVLLVKNTNDFSVEIDHGSAYDVTSDNFTGSIKNYCNDFTSIIHPNGSDFLMDPNSELQVVFDISLPNFNNQDDSLEGDLVFHYDFKFLNSTDGADVIADIPVAINSYITYLGRNARSDNANRNATIKGKIVDVNSNPISEVEVEIFNCIDEGLEIIRTNENGEFEFQVTANKSAITNMWHECLLVMKHPSYDDKYLCIYPKEGQTNEVLVTLPEPSEKISYTNTGIVDLGIQAYSFDTDAEKSIIAFTPFHSGLQYDNIKDKVNLNVTDFDGNTLFQYHLNAETPWVCVSDDGQYIVAIQATEEGNDSSTDVVILDDSGNTVYTSSVGKEVDTPQGIQLETIHSRCAQLSHDNQYLVVGSDDGDFWVIDWQNDNTLWTYKTHGQVRNIVFNEDNSILLVSSGDGFMYGFDITGNVLFKTFVGSWATDMELADNVLAYTLKTSWDCVGAIDISTGEQLWTYAALARGSGLAVSKDKKYVWWGNDVSSSYSCINNVLFDIQTGEIAYVLNCDAGQKAMFSDNGKYLVVKTGHELEVFETEKYRCVMYLPVVDEFGENAASINQTVAVNEDASKIVAAFNNDPSERVYGQAYYYTLN